MFVDFVDYPYERINVSTNAYILLTKFLFVFQEKYGFSNQLSTKLSSTNQKMFDNLRIAAPMSKFKSTQYFVFAKISIEFLLTL